MKDIISVASEAALEAGRLLRQHFGTVTEVRKKEDNSLVSALDKKSESVIIDYIRTHFPRHRILSEESNQVKQADAQGYTWIIDPLDGTHNYLNAWPLFAVSIGIVKDTEFVAGVIYLPYTMELYTAEKSCGAFKNGGRITVAAKQSLGACSLVFDSGFRHFTQTQYNCLANITPHVFNFRVSGCSVGNLALCAEGKCDIIVEFDDYPWDYAAGVPIVKEAGGVVSSLNGGMFTLGDRSYIACNTLVHPDVVACLR